MCLFLQYPAFFLILQHWRVGGALNVMTEKHTQHAHRPTHTHTRCQITLSLLPFMFLCFFLLSFLCILLTQLNPRTFLPFFCLSLFSDVLSHSNGPFASSSLSFFLQMTKEQLRELAPAGVHGNSPSSSPTLLTLIKAFPRPHPTRFNPLATPYL